MKKPDPADLIPDSDPLGESLHLLRPEGTLYCQAEMSAPWAIAVPRLEGLMTFLVVTEGRCWLSVEGAPPLLMERDALALIPHGTPHRIGTDPALAGLPLFDLPVTKVSERFQTMRHGGGGAVTRTMYGAVRFDHVAARHLVAHLPLVMPIVRWPEEAAAWMRETLRFIAAEATRLRPGGETVLTRLADVVVIQAIRAWLDTAPEADCGWLGALRDPGLGRALTAMHRRPGDDWTLPRLAREAGMSRSTFAERFRARVGTAPAAYLAEWRLTLARSRLMDGTAPVGTIAADLGYGSETAFCRAFRRRYGTSPGRMRRAARAA